MTAPIHLIPIGGHQAPGPELKFLRDRWAWSPERVAAGFIRCSPLKPWGISATAWLRRTHSGPRQPLARVARMAFESASSTRWTAPNWTPRSALAPEVRTRFTDGGPRLADPGRLDCLAICSTWKSAKGPRN